MLGMGWVGFSKTNSGQVETCLNLALLVAGLNDQQLDSRRVMSNLFARFEHVLFHLDLG